MRVFNRMYIGGEWAPSESTESIEVHNPATEEVVARVPAGTAADVDRAVAAARSAFHSWSRTTPAERSRWLGRIQEGLQARAEDIAQAVTEEVGAPIELSRAIQVGLPILNFGNAAELAAGYAFEVGEVGNSVVVREPVGVVGCITPWNYPLHQIALKVAPALAAGCTVVIKPSEVAPTNAFLLMEIIDEIGLPAGVVNLVSGVGTVVGEAIAAHPDVDMLSFTGSTRAGRRVQVLAAETVKRVALELGGKSANIVLDDADLETAVTDGVAKCFLNSGQTCSALTRMLVPRQHLAEAGRIAAKAAESYTVGDPLDSGTQLGPLVSELQLQRVRGYIETGLAEGAELLTGGALAPEHTTRGYFVRPTVFSGVTREMTIAREEIFGPVLVVMPYETEEEAVELANDTVYGLAGGVWSGDADRAERVARRLRAGQIEVNGGAFNPLAPFGGYKQSGIGREAGSHGIEEFLETKAIQR